MRPARGRINANTVDNPYLDPFDDTESVADDPVLPPRCRGGAPGRPGRLLDGVWPVVGSGRWGSRVERDSALWHEADRRLGIDRYA